MRARAAPATTPIRAALIALLLSACAGIQPFVPDTARLRPETFGFGVLSADVYAVQQAQWAFADPSRTHGRPLEAARASAAMDYIAGQLNTSPRWANISAITKMQLLEGREEVRRALGVRPGVSSQAVVDTLAGISNALIAGDQTAAFALANAPIFEAPGEPVMAQLSNMPYLRMANVSTMRAANELFRPSGGIRAF